MRHPRREDIYLVNFDSTLGAKIQKTRPVLIIQNDIGNRTSDITTVAAISSQLKGKRYPFEAILPAVEALKGRFFSLSAIFTDFPHAWLLRSIMPALRLRSG